MKTFKEFIQEQPTMSGGNPQAFSHAATASGPVAGYDKRLFPGDEDLLSQDFQTPAETGLYKWQLGSGVYPVMKVSLKSNLGDGPSIDSICLLYTSPSPRDKRQSRMPSSA